jgi:hypothetical protein
MLTWWERRWRLVIFIIVFPLWMTPVMSLILFPQVPLIRAALYGAIFTLFLAVGFRAAQVTKALGVQIVIAIVLIAVFTGLLIGILPKLT